MWAAVVAGLALATCCAAKPVPDGWRMQDRFRGFRFECSGEFDRNEWAVSIRDFADELSGFGWVQLSPAGSLVGEFRGTKQTGQWMRQFLEEGPGVTNDRRFGCSFLEYEDTKIRFHFSHFKVLDQSRRTCFSEPPHSCTAAKGADEVHDEL
jgi:hypothetical protein